MVFFVVVVFFQDRFSSMLFLASEFKFIVALSKTLGMNY